MLGAGIYGVTMSQLTSALEKLYKAIDTLEQAIDTRVSRLEKQQTDLFSQLENERDHAKTATQELDDIIFQLEKTLQSESASVR